MGLWVPKLRAEYIIEGALYQEALDYARRSRAYTSDRHDFHSGGLDNKQQKMLEGKIKKGDRVTLDAADDKLVLTHKDAKAPAENENKDE